MIKKMLILLATLIFAITTFTVSVFAWFTESGNQANLGQFGGEVISFEAVDIESDFEFRFHTPNLDGITYLQNSDLSNNDFNYENYASTLYIELTNVTEKNIRVRAGIKMADHTIPGQYAGTIDGLIFMAYDRDGQYPTYASNDYQTTLNNIKSINNSGIVVPANETVWIAIDIWGYYNGLLDNPELRTFDDKYALYEVYYALIYRGVITLKAA